MRRAYIGMGGNLASWAGAPDATLAAAAARLESLGRVVERSSLYSTAPVGFTPQPRFVNAVAALETELEPRELLDRLLEIEQAFGRERRVGFANGPRTLDLDILLLGQIEIHESDLEIPHPRLAERLFVLAPLSEIAARLRIPGCGKTAEELLDCLRSTAASEAEGCKGESDAAIRIESDAWTTTGR